MIELQAWVALPVLVYLLSLGVGLLAERATGTTLPNALVPPVGLAVLVLVITPIYRLGAGAEVAAPLAVVVALVGLVLSRREVRSRLNPGPVGLAGLGAFVLYLAPVALSGQWSWAGYNFVNDTASNLVFADYVAHNGVTVPEVVDSTTVAIADIPMRLNYPLGAHFLLASVEPLTGASLEAIYQPFMAFIGGMAAMGLAVLARHAGLPAWAAAAAGLLASVPVLLHRYVLHGGIKEILVVALLATAAAVGWELVARRAGIRALALLAVLLAPLPAVFSATGALYGVALGAPLFVAALVRRRPSRRQLALAGAAVLGVGLVAAAPTLADTIRFGREASQAFAAEGGETTAYMGQLLRPLPFVEAAGIWFARDYRLDVGSGTGTLNDVLIVVALALVVVGAAWELARRRPAAVLLLAAVAIVSAALAPALSPYADGKLLVVLSPALVLTAAVGVYALWVWGRGGRVLAVVAGAALAGGILWSVLVGYREVQLAPPARVKAMEDAADHARGGGLWLVNEWEEYAKFFMRSIRVNPAFEAASPQAARLRDPRRPLFGRHYDLDEERLSYVARFPGIIKRRAPDASRPPASYEMTYRNDHYEVWRRRPGLHIVEHLPLQRRYAPGLRPACAAVRRMARRARRGDRLVAASRPALALMDPRRSRRSRGWVRRWDVPGVVIPSSPGEASGRVRTAPGRYRVWVRGSFGRATSAFVDRRRVGAARVVNTPEQWIQVGTLALPGGPHLLELRRGGPSLRPGDAYRGVIGPLALERIEPAPLVSVAPARSAHLCGRVWDWVELVRGARA